MSMDNADRLQIIWPEEVNQPTSRQSNLSYTREFLLSFGDLETCKRPPKGFDESLLSEFGSLSVQGFRRNDYGSSPPGEGVASNFTRVVDRWDSRASGRSDIHYQDSDSGKRYGSQLRRSWQNPEHDGLQIIRPEEANQPSSRESKLSYTREFLLSFGDLEICKRPPKGFDESLLSEFGSLSEQGFRRNDYGSSPPSEGEASNFTRVIDRWDSRASGRSDTHSQGSDSGKGYGSQFRRSWQNLEHDGLLGSGSVPRPPGYRPGASAPTSRADDLLHLKKSSDPYQPPRPFKSAPYPRRDKDSYNDETFGMDESTSEDRVEEEIKRRAEFEMMRKEQHKLLKENLKYKAIDKLKDDPMIEIAGSPDSGGDAVISNQLETSLMNPLQQNDSDSLSISSQGNPIRPRVPPGFATVAVDKISGPKSLKHPGPFEAGKVEIDGSKDEKPDLMNLGDNQHVTTSPLASKGRIRGQSSSKTIDSLEISEVLQSGNMGSHFDNLDGHKVRSETIRSTSILEKFFGGALSVNSDCPPEIVEDEDNKTDEVWSPKDSQLQTSKFVHLFVEEENKRPENGSLQKPNDLLSMIAGEKSGLIASEPKSAQRILPLESNLMKLTTSTHDDAGISELLCSNSNKPKSVSAFLTCEDLEQSILLNVGDNSSSSQPPGIVCSNRGMENEIPKSNIDKNASQHLLSLLQMGNICSSSKSMPPFYMTDKGFPTEPQELGGEGNSDVQRNVRDGDAENLNSGKGLTLETLFGTAFMNELHSADAPVSVQRNSAISTMDVLEPCNPPPLASDNGALANLASFVTRPPEEDMGLPGHFAATKAEMFLSTNPQAKTSDKLATLGQRQDNTPFLHGPFDMKPEIPHSTMYVNSVPVNYMRPMFHPLDPHSAHMDPQFNFMPQDASIRHQFPEDLGHHGMYRHPSSGISEFETQIHPMLQQMHLPNNLPSSHNLPGLPDCSPPVYMPEHNPIQSFPFGQQQPNLGGHGIRQGPEHRDINNHPPPQALQRLIEMELRSSQKPMHRPGSGHDRPVYGHELDAAGVWYR